MQKLKDLLSKFEITQGFSLLDQSVKQIYSDSRQVESGSLFIAIKGSLVDGHDFLPQVCEKMPLAIVINENAKVPANYAGVVAITKDTSKSISELAARFYDDPTSDMFVAGVTGTNGKTSITYLTECVLAAKEYKTGVIGTVNHHLQNKVWPSNMTTPDPISLQQRLLEMQQAGANALAIEVSSHALDQYRCDGINFNVAQFTNLTRDHLDYHKTMDAYFYAKLRFFKELLNESNKKNKASVLNIDDSFGPKILSEIKKMGLDHLSYGQSSCELQFKILSMNFTETRFSIRFEGKEFEFILPMSGLHNVYNACAAIGAGIVAGLSLDKMAEVLERFSGVPGRLQQIGNQKGLAIFVDYAHSPDALENVLLSLQKVKGKNSDTKLWTIFGCGGDRDKGKRPQMAAVAQKLSDYVMVTSDNPRTEDPEKIILDIFTGFSNQPGQILKNSDRKLAIEEVLQRSKSHDVVLIAGKGHEDYQIIGTKKFDFSDVKVVEEYFKTWKN